MDFVAITHLSVTNTYRHMRYIGVYLLLGFGLGFTQTSLAQQQNHCTVFSYHHNEISLYVLLYSKKRTFLLEKDWHSAGSCLVFINASDTGTYTYKNRTLTLFGRKGKRYIYTYNDSVNLVPNRIDSKRIPKAQLSCSCMNRPDGSVVWRGFWRNGRKNGYWEYFDKAGNSIKTEFYRNGVLGDPPVDHSIMIGDTTQKEIIPIPPEW